MTDTQFVSAFTPEGGARISLQRSLPARGLFGRSRTEILPTSAWIEADPSGRAIMLLDRAEAGSASEAGDFVILPPQSVAALSEDEALSLGLPPAAPLVLSLRGRGLITDNNFAIETRWMRTSGADVAARVVGAHAAVSGQQFRLPDPLFTLFRAASAINAASDRAARQASLADLRRQLDGHEDQVALDGLLSEIRVAFAGNFSLSVNPDQGGVNFDPVLFAPRIGDVAADGNLIDEASDNLLTPSQQSDFAAAFRRGTGSRRSYLLSDGLLLFVDPALSRALQVVGERQRASPSERRRFASSPRRAIAEALGGGDDLEAMFIETTQYSERVIGIDPWRKPVLPWIKSKPNSWLPESYGLTVGDPPVSVDIDQAALSGVIERISAAIAAGAEVIVIDGKEVPATPATMQALENLLALESASSAASNTDRDPPAELSGKLFLQVHDNLEDMAYAPLARAQAAPSKPAEVPASVTTALKPHQLTGFRWMVDAWRAGRPGVLLADDMGLGKTLQALTFFCWLRESEAAPGPVLIVAPTGLLTNWQAEMERHLAPNALGPVVRVFGDDLKNARLGPGTDTARGAAGLATERWQDGGVILTTYETLRDYHISLARMGFAAAAFDEAQRIKNPSAQVTRAAKTLRARFSVAITGTPVENRLQDLWSIADTVHPGLLGASKAFEEQYGAADISGLRELNAKLTGAAAPWPAFMLRRMKADHIEGLPDKKQIEMVRPMPPAQAAAYGSAVARALAQRGSDNPEPIIQTLARLRSISLAPDLPSPGSEFASRSARLQATLAILDNVHAKGEKALIFCESLQLQPLLAAELRRRYAVPHSVACISGDVPGHQRQHIVDLFQNRPAGFDVLILSPKAGGVGLTITAANHVIHLTRWWNPAVEDQATDRVFRLGQTKDVTVWIPIAEHPDPALAAASFDHRLGDLLRRKRTVAHGLLAEPESANDAQSLLEDVLGTSDPAIEANTVQHFAAQVSQGSAESDSPAIVFVPSEAAPLQSARFRKMAGDPPPFDVFTDTMASKDVRRLSVVDPYAAGSRENCCYFAEFLSVLRASGIVFNTITLTAWDDDSLVNGRVGSNAEQRRVLRDAITHFRLDDLRIIPDLVSRRKQPLHDRSVTAHFGDGSKIVWDLGRGIDGFMNKRLDCTIGRWVNPPEGVT